MLSTVFCPKRVPPVPILETFHAVSFIDNDAIFVIPRVSALFTFKAESERFDPRIEEISRLPSAFCICALDSLMYDMVDAGPKLSNLILDVMSALDAVIYVVLIDGVVAGAFKKFRKLDSFRITHCALSGPNTILLATVKFLAEVNKLLTWPVEIDPLIETSARIVVERRKFAPEKELILPTLV